MCAVAAIAVLTSCDEKIERSQVAGDVYVHAVKSESGNTVYKLSLLSDGFYTDLTENTYSRVEYNEQAKLVLAYNGRTFVIISPEGRKLGSQAGYAKLTVSGKFVYLFNNSLISVYLPEKGFVFGPYADIKIVEDKIFAHGPKGWGLLDTEYHYLQDMVFEKLYIVNQKSATEYDVLRCRDGKWSMATSEDAVYDEESTKSALKLFNKQFKPNDPVGIIPFKF